MQTIKNQVNLREGMSLFSDPQIPFLSFPLSALKTEISFPPIYPGIFSIVLERGIPLLGTEVFNFSLLPLEKKKENVKMERKCELLLQVEVILLFLSGNAYIGKDQK